MRDLRGLFVVLAIGAVVGGGLYWWRSTAPATMPVALKRLTGVPPEVGEPKGRDQSITAPDDPVAARRSGPPLYKWKDANGVWNITDAPPKDRPFEQVVVNPDQNVVPTVVPGQTEPYREPETDD